MTKHNDYQSGQQDGRNGFIGRSSNSDYLKGYYNGKQEYEYWNDTNLYPSLRYDSNSSQLSQASRQEDVKIGIGSVFRTLFAWILLLAPLSLFLTWDNWFYETVFWGGIGIIVLLFLVWISNIVKVECQRKDNQSSRQSENDPNLPWYKKYPPADVIKKGK